MKAILSVLLVTALFLEPTDLFAQRKHYGGGRHTSSHGGHYKGGRGSSHKGGHYRNSSTGNRYGKHK